MLSCLSLFKDHRQPCMLSCYKDSKTRQEISRKKENLKKKEITLAQNKTDTLRFICTFKYNIVLFNHLYYLYTQFSCILTSVNSQVLCIETIYSGKYEIKGSPSDAGHWEPGLQYRLWYCYKGEINGTKIN